MAALAPSLHCEACTVILRPVVLVQGKYQEAEALSKRVIVIWKGVLGSAHPQVGLGMKDRAMLLQQLVRTTTVENCDPHMYTGYNCCLVLLRYCWPALLLTNWSSPTDPFTNLQGKLEEADLLYERVVMIWEAGLGTDHPNVALALNERAVLWASQVRVERSVQDICQGPQRVVECVFGSCQMRLYIGLLIITRGGLGKVGPIDKKSFVTREKVLMPEHSYCAKSLSNRRSLIQCCCTSLPEYFFLLQLTFLPS